MPTPKEMAIAEIREKTNIPAHTNWDKVLSQVEKAVLDYKKPGIVEFLARSAERVFHHITKNTKFMIVLVFNGDYSQVTALPLPEIFENKERVQLAASSLSVKDNIECIPATIEALHDIPAAALHGGEFRHAIVVEQNLGEFRDENELLVGFWNTWKAKDYTQARLYDGWIHDAYNDLLDRRPSPGKNAENAV